MAIPLSAPVQEAAAAAAHSSSSSLIESHTYVSIGGVPFITDAVIVSWMIMAVLIIIAAVGTRNLKPVPTGLQNGLEAYVGFAYSYMKETIGSHYYRSYVPYLGTLFLYLLLANAAALFNILPSGDFWVQVTGNHALQHFELPIHQPTKNINVTACLAIMSIVLVIASEFRAKGFVGWLKSWYRPSPINFFVKILDYLVRPLSLTLRLFGNMVGGTICIGLLYGAFPWILPGAVGIWFDMFDALLQAGVFVFLTSVYIAEAVE